MNLAAIEKLNQEHWARTKQMLDDAPPFLLSMAMDRLSEDVGRGVPFGNQLSFEGALIDVTNIVDRAKAEIESSLKQEARSEFARAGGKAEKPDALQRWIIAVVQENPSITVTQLILKIENEASAGTFFYDITDRTLTFDDDGPLKDAPLSGLKDRLSRAKKKILSR